MNCYVVLAALVLGTSVVQNAFSDEMTADKYLDKYDAIMGPKNYESDSEMTAMREDGTTRSYVMHMMKFGEDKFRLWFKKPAAVAGQEILRVGDNSWVYLPTMKRANRMANRDNFQGGDFNNADILRVNYKVDYTPKILDKSATAVHLELKSKNESTAYDLIQLWVAPVDGMPIKSQYFGASGKILRSAEFFEVKDFGSGYRRPSKIKMKNEVIPSRWTEMVFLTVVLNSNMPAQRFTLTDLGK